jgi:DNA-directed RNA polymerase specialized sigma24 family protein
MKTYDVTCKWDDAGVWVVTVPAVRGAITQCRRLDQVTDQVGEVIELMTGEQPGDYVLRVEWDVPGELGEVAHRAEGLRRDAQAVVEQADEATRQAVARLREAGFSYRDIGAMTGVSHQRAQQIAASLAA